MITKKTTLILIVALAASGVSGCAQDRDVASLHQFNLLADISSNFRVILHNRVRFYNDIRDFFRYRMGRSFSMTGSLECKCRPDTT